MTKKILWIGGIATLALGLVAMPSPSASVQDDGTSSVQPQKIQEAFERADIQDKVNQAVQASAVAMAQYEDALQRVKILPGQLDQDTLTVLTDDEGPSWLGVEAHEVTAENAKDLKLPAERGVLVGRVTPDSPAAKAGLKERDVITEVNGQRVEGAAQFRRIVHEIPAGRTAQLTVWRDGRTQTLSVTLGKAEETHRTWMSAAPGAPGAFTFRMPEVEIPEIPPVDFGGEVMMFPGGRARLGIDAEDIAGQLGSYFGAPDGEGVLVRSVNSDSPAEKAGLKAGDVITSLNGERIRTAGDLREKLAGKDEKQVKLGVLRNKSELTLTVELPKTQTKTRKVIGHRTYI